MSVRRGAAAQGPRPAAGPPRTPPRRTPPPPKHRRRRPSHAPAWPPSRARGLGSPNSPPFPSARHQTHHRARQLLADHNVLQLQGDVAAGAAARLLVAPGRARLPLVAGARVCRRGLGRRGRVGRGGGGGLRLHLHGRHAHDAAGQDGGGGAAMGRRWVVGSGCEVRRKRVLYFFFSRPRLRRPRLFPFRHAGTRRPSTRHTCNSPVGAGRRDGAGGLCEWRG